MTTEKSERLLNLLIMLLVQRQYVTKERIRAILYPGSSDEAFEKMFERDKDELRSLGVPVEVGQVDAYFDDEPGYRIRPDEFALPPIELTQDEAAVVGLATQVWQHATLAKASTEAFRKLQAAGIEIATEAVDIAQPRLMAEEPSFDVFWDAVVERTPVTFDYARRGEDEPTRRHLQPWGVTRYSGRWYVVGYDTDRRDERIFRLSRVVGRARRSGAPGSFEVPPGTDAAAIARRLAPDPRPVQVSVLARTGSAWPLRRQGEVSYDVAGPDTRTGWDRIRLTRPASGLVDEALGFGPDLYLEEPEWARERLIERLREVRR